MPYCPFCGSEISEEDSFCQSCGASLGQGVPQSPQRPRRNTTRIIVIAVVGFILLSTIASAVFILMAENVITGSDIKETYSWEYEGKNFSCTIDVKRADYNRMMSSNIDRTGSLSTDRYTIDGGTVPGVCDYIVVDSYIKGLSDSLRQKYEGAFGSAPTNDQYVKFASAFVQLCISYDNDEATSATEYWRFPLETLCDRKGDCEDSSILLAALIDAAGLKGGVIILPGHAMCAILDSDLASAYPNIRHSSVYDVDFYPIETTGDEFWDIGEEGSRFNSVYHHLYLGSVESYLSS